VNQSNILNKQRFFDGPRVLTGSALSNGSNKVEPSAEVRLAQTGNPHLPTSAHDDRGCRTTNRFADAVCRNGICDNKRLFAAAVRRREQPGPNPRVAYLARHQVDGLIFLGGRVNEITPTPEHQREIAAFSAQVPTVIVNGEMPGIETVTICTDERGGIAQVVDHLANLGHQRIALLGGSDHITVTRNRQQAFREEMAAFGLPVNEAWLITCGFSIESGDKVMEALLQAAEQPTAVIAINDLVALGIQNARRHHMTCLNACRSRL
jgi:hypothetical protein